MCETINYEKLPFVSISKENLQLIYDTLEPIQVGNVILALYPFLYEGVEPNFETKAERGAWNQIIAVITRKGVGLLEQIEKGEKGAEAGIKGKEFGKLGGRPRKGETKEEYQARKQAEVIEDAPVEEDFNEEVTEEIEPEIAPSTGVMVQPSTEPEEKPNTVQEYIKGLPIRKEIENFLDNQFFIGLYRGYCNENNIPEMEEIARKYCRTPHDVDLFNRYVPRIINEIAI